MYRLIPYKSTFITVLILLAVQTVSGRQNYPVQASVQINPPYSLYLNDYAANGSEQMQVGLFLKDLSKSNYPCRLRLKIEGFGISIQSKNDFYVRPLYLNGGEPVVFSGADLEPYLNARNLFFQGISQASLNLNGGKLPEGVYRVSVEVLDYFRKSVVSNPGSTVLSVFLSYPPVINMPISASTLTASEPQNIVFQWTPRHTGSVNAAYQVAYKFRLTEIIPHDRNPNDAIRNSRPIYETYTDQTMLVYGPAEPALIPGNRYALQVQAVEAEGKDLFINNGNSEVIWFTYGEKCPQPQNLVAELNTISSLKMSWMAMPQQQAFSIRYRESDQPAAEWFEREVFTPGYSAYGLRPGKTYEYQVKSACAYGYGEYTPLQRFKMPAGDLSTGDIVCGQAAVVELVDRTTQLNLLQPGMVFMAGTFPIKVTEAEGGNGTFSGSGTVGIPFLNKLDFKVTFENITINAALKLTGGKVSVMARGLEQSKEQLLASITVIPDGNGNAVIASTNGLPAIIDVAIAMPGTMPVYHASDKTIRFTATLPGGKSKDITVKVNAGLPVTFQDRNGETFEVDTTGKVDYRGKIAKTELLAGGALSAADLDTSLGKAGFNPAPDQKYGFDAYNQSFAGNSKYAAGYQKIKDGEGTSGISWKSLETGRTDQVLVDVIGKDKSLDLSKIELRNGQGERLTATQKGNSFLLNVMGTTEGNDKEIYGFYPTGKDEGVNLGKLNLASYRRITKKVMIVPMNGAGVNLSKAEIESELNRIYAQAIVEWDVELDKNFEADPALWDTNSDGALEAGNSSLMSAYTAEQKALAGLYKTGLGMMDDTYYIFLTGRLSDGSSGYMVRSGQVGFVGSLTPTGAPPSAGVRLSQIIAHELGHGAFNLQHTWDEPGTEKSATDNLMDYAGGTTLAHSQWQYMRNPDLVMKVFEGDDEGAIIDSRKYVLETLNKIKVAHQKDQSIIQKDLPSPKNAVRIPDAVLGEITYSFIQLEIHNKKAAIHPRGNITEISSKNMNGQTLYGLDIDGNIQVYVPRDKVNALKIYLTSPADKNLVVFVNGYLLDQEFVKTPDVVYQGDVWKYWVGIDAQFMKQLNSHNAVYANGNDYIVTSNHRTHIEFAKSMASYYTFFPQQSRLANVLGFKRRYENGKEAGKDMVRKLKAGTIICRKTIINGKVTITDTVDIVAHSMGYAYSLGIIEVLQQEGIKVGRYYVIAGENSCSGWVPKDIEEIWQYGSDEENDPIKQQDGVAPQCPIPGIGGNRAYIPKNAIKGFTESHSVGNYKWIFTTKKQGDAGYVKSRN